MITIKSLREIDIMARAGRIVAGVHALMRDLIRPGVTTEELDAAAESFIRRHPGATPSFKGLYGFPKTLCVSIDEEIVHGIPSKKRTLELGSIVSVDVGVQLEGLHADAATTIPVGTIAPEAQRLLDVTEQCLAAGVAQARVGNHVGDIGHAWCGNWSGTVSAPGFTRSRRCRITARRSAVRGCSRA
jgi:methionyl aminopeptidase